VTKDELIAALDQAVAKAEADQAHAKRHNLFTAIHEQRGRLEALREFRTMAETLTVSEG
jgi:hypothetical protein